MCALCRGKAKRARRKREFAHLLSALTLNALHQPQPHRHPHRHHCPHQHHRHHHRHYCPRHHHHCPQHLEVVKMN